jgi:hypothetical protein
MGKFYKALSSSTNLNDILQKNIDKYFKTYYYSNQNTGVPSNTQNGYKFGDYILVKTNGKAYIMDGKFMIYESNPFGECTKTKAVKFMTPNEPASCGLKMVYKIIL